MGEATPDAMGPAVRPWCPAALPPPPMTRRERVAEVTVGGGFVAAAAVVAATVPFDHSVEVVPGPARARRARRRLARALSGARGSPSRSSSSSCRCSSSSRCRSSPVTTLGMMLGGVPDVVRGGAPAIAAALRRRQRVVHDRSDRRARARGCDRTRGRRRSSCGRLPRRPVRDRPRGLARARADHRGRPAPRADRGRHVGVRAWTRRSRPSGLLAAMADPSPRYVVLMLLPAARACCGCSPPSAASASRHSLAELSERLPRHRARCSATWSRPTTPTPASTAEDVVELSLAVGRRARPRRRASAATSSSARCCTTSARSRSRTRSSTSPARSTTRSGQIISTPHDRGPARCSTRSAACSREVGAIVRSSPRALGRRRLPGRPRRRGDPARGAHHLRPATPSTR